MNYEICKCCGKPKKPKSPVGRWPANFLHDGSDEVLGLFPVTSTHSTGRNDLRKYNDNGMAFQRSGNVSGYTTDTGSAARFFYCAKASKLDRNEGITDGSNTHPTVKPTDLMRYLCRLVTPPGGIILDNFMGSGSTGKAAILEGFDFIGVEQDVESVEIARARIEYALVQARNAAGDFVLTHKEKQTGQMALFGNG